MTELDGWDDPLEYFHKVFVSALDRFTRCNRGRRMGNEDAAKSRAEFKLRDKQLDPVGNIKHLFVSPGGNGYGRRGHNSALIKIALNRNPGSKRLVYRALLGYLDQSRLLLFGEITG